MGIRISTRRAANYIRDAKRLVPATDGKRRGFRDGYYLEGRRRGKLSRATVLDLPSRIYYPVATKEDRAAQVAGLTEATHPTTSVAGVAAVSRELFDPTVEAPQEFQPPKEHEPKEDLNVRTQYAWNRVIAYQIGNTPEDINVPVTGNLTFTGMPYSIGAEGEDYLAYSGRLYTTKTPLYMGDCYGQSFCFYESSDEWDVLDFNPFPPERRTWLRVDAQDGQTEHRILVEEERIEALTGYRFFNRLAYPPEHPSADAWLPPQTFPGATYFRTPGGVLYVYVPVVQNSESDIEGYADYGKLAVLQIAVKLVDDPAEEPQASLNLFPLPTDNPLFQQGVDDEEDYDRLPCAMELDVAGMDEEGNVVVYGAFLSDGHKGRGSLEWQMEMPVYFLSTAFRMNIYPNQTVDWLPLASTGSQVASDPDMDYVLNPPDLDGEDWQDMQLHAPCAAWTPTGGVCVWRATQYVQRVGGQPSTLSESTIVSDQRRCVGHSRFESVVIAVADQHHTSTLPAGYRLLAPDPDPRSDAGGSFEAAHYLCNTQYYCQALRWATCHKYVRYDEEGRELGAPIVGVTFPVYSEAADGYVLMRWDTEDGFQEWPDSKLVAAKGQAIAISCYQRILEPLDSHGPDASEEMKVGFLISAYDRFVPHFVVRPGEDGDTAPMTWAYKRGQLVEIAKVAAVGGDPRYVGTVAQIKSQIDPNSMFGVL